MSGTMDWNTGYAAETDVGVYLFPLDVSHGKHPGWAETNGGGPAYWDMDWSWGSKAVPLQYPGFDVVVTGSPGNYRVTMTPAAAGATALTVTLEDITAISVNPTSIDFGSLIPGQASDVFSITVDNVGTRTVDVAAWLTALSASLFKNNLEMRLDATGSFVKGTGALRTWSDIITSLVMNDSKYVQTRLTVPPDYTPKGTEEATLIFEATALP